MIIDFEKHVHRTWVQLLIDHNLKEAASIAIDIKIDIYGYQSHEYSGEGPHDDLEAYAYFDNINVRFSIPYPTYKLVKENEKIKKVMEQGLIHILKTQELPFSPINDEEGYYYRLPENANFYFEYRMTLLEVEQGWQDKIKLLIANSGLSNQGLISEKARARRGETPLTYNEIKFASHSEIRIAQELEARKVLFFPLPLAVRAQTGNIYNDHREVDFLICDNGSWGVLEVSYHPNRFEEDAEKDAWFKTAGLLCIQHYTAERCYRDAAGVVKEFLAILSKHK